MAERRVPQEPVALLLAGLGAPAAPPAEPRAAAPVAAPPVPDHLAELDARIEAVLIAADRGLPLAALASAVDRPIAVVRQAVERIRADYDGATGGRRRGFELRETASGWRLFARPEHDPSVRALLAVDQPARLSQAALETLAVVAYRQPITRAGVAAIRAVSVDSVLRTLQARGLVAEVGRTEETGAALYGTTDLLLDALGLQSLDDLPPIAPLLAGADEVAEHVG
jgi:segregation and condensation protein B